MPEIRFRFNKLYAPVFTTKARYIDVWGGRAAGRSHFGTDYFLFLITKTDYFRGCFMRNTFSDIRDSLFQDFKDRIDANEDLDEEDFDINESRMMITYKPTGNTIISKGFKKSSGNRTAKLKSLAGITHVLIEEADENNEDDVNKLDDSIRTDKIENIQVIFLHNPPHKNHWICKRFYNLEDCGLSDENGKPLPYYRATPKKSDDILVVFSTYKDNVKNLNAKTVAKYEAYNDPNSIFYNPEYYYIDVLGLISEGARGRIYKNWRHITTNFFESLPYPSFYGNDFGFSDDPNATVELKTHNNRLFVRQVVYESGLTNPQLAKKWEVRGVNKKKVVYADSAEPKSIKELKDLGFNVQEADKGPDSLLFGIKLLQSLEVYVTDDSKDIWIENEEYRWELDKENKPTDTPEDKHNHAMDAIRYGYTTYKQLKRKSNVKVGQTDKSVVSKLDWV